jgi:hypothetical protein
MKIMDIYAIKGELPKILKAMCTIWGPLKQSELTELTWKGQHCSCPKHSDHYWSYCVLKLGDILVITNVLVVDETFLFLLQTLYET